MDEKQVQALFLAIDRMDVEGFLSFLNEHALFQFGNFPAAKGKQAIQIAVSNFFSSIKSLNHEILNAWSLGDVLICNGTATYIRKDDRTITLPFCNVFMLKNGLINEYLVYVDVSPLFA